MAKKYSRRDLLKLTGKATLAVGTGVVAATMLPGCGGSNQSADSGVSDGDGSSYHAASSGTLAPRRYTIVES